MTGLWLISYLTLWGLVIILCLLVLGTLGQLGLLRRQLEPNRRKAEAPPRKAEEDGPQIGSRLPDLRLETFNGFGTLNLAALPEKEGKLILFLAATCESCQHLADPLNKLVEIREHQEEVIVFLEGDQQTCQGFQILFPLHVPAICASDRTYKDLFGIHTIPFGMFYSANGTLIRKGFPTSAPYLRALLGETSVVADLAPDTVFPLPSSSEMPVPATL